MDPPISGARLRLQRNNRFSRQGRDLRDFRSFVPAHRSGLSNVVPLEGSRWSRSPSPLSEPSPKRDDLVLDSPESIETEQPPTIRSGWDAWLERLSEMSLPGLGLDDADDIASAGLPGFAPNVGAGVLSQSKQYELAHLNEWRFELALGRSITIKLISGNAEFFATELVTGHSYTFTSKKGAVSTFDGCTLEVTSDAGPLSSALASEYVAEDSTYLEYFNTHLALEKMRTQAATRNTDGPRTLIVGPDNSGKTTLAKTIVAYGIRDGRSSIVVNLDPAEGVLSLPGTFTATVFKSLIEIEEGWGNAPMSGPNGDIPVKQPLVYYYGSMNPSDKNGTVFRNQIRQLGLGISGKMASDPETKIGGLVVDTPGTLVNGLTAATGYDLLTHVVSEFGIDTIICLGSERLYSDMVKKFDGTPISRSTHSSAAAYETEKIAVMKLTKSGGVADRDAAYMQALRQAQTKLYFYGSGRFGAGIALQPRQQQVDFDTITVWRRISSSGAATSLAFGGNGNAPIYDEDSFLPGGADDTDSGAAASAVPLPATQVFERLTAPIPALRNCVLAVMNCPPEPDNGSEQEVLRDSSVMGFLYVTDVDEARRRISLLSPVAGRVPERALVWGEGVDGVLGLI